MSDHPVESVAVSVPSQSGPSSADADGQRSDIWTTPIKKSWSSVTTSVEKACLAVLYSLSEIWSPLAYHVLVAIILIPDCISRLISRREYMAFFRFISWREYMTLVPHMILCLTMTFFLPISLLRKLILTKGKFPPTWERILLVISCIALAVDPLFFYIPFIDEKSKCIGMDKKLRAVVLALRSLTDLTFALNIDAQIRHYLIDDFDYKFFELLFRRLKWFSQDMIEFLVIIPIPQVIIVTIFFRMNGSGYPYKTAIGNAFLILQFIARGCQIYHFQKPFKRVGKWAKIAFFFLIYVLVGHILGAFWYFLSIQREISCWHQTCRNTTGCLAINYCKDTNYSTSITLLDEFCPINPSNATLFDFGVFLDALQSGNTGSKSFSTKYFYTFWWGIRNLSNFGTNLETSNDLWENCFTILISLVGLLLFLYLMGNVQTYILWESNIELENEQKKINSKYEALDTWMVRNGIPEDVKTGAVKIITEKKVVEKNYDDDVDLVFVFNALTGDEDDKVKIKLGLMQYLCQNAIPKVFMLKYVDIWFPIGLSTVLEPVVYKANSYVATPGKSKHRMLIITEGVVVCTESTDNTGANVARFEKGEVYVEELLNGYLPNIPKYVKCETKVEGFGISCRGFDDRLRPQYISWGTMYQASRTTVNKEYKELTTTRSVKLQERQKKIIEWLSRNTIPDDLQTLVMEHINANNVLEKNWDAEVDVKYLFSIGLSWDIEYRIKKQICINSLSKVPVLEGVNEDVLSRICMSLEPLVLPQHSSIFYPLSAIDRMLIVVEGEITVTETTYDKESTEMKRGNVERRINKSDVIGEELLTWAFYIVSHPAGKCPPAILEKYVECPTKVEAFALTMEGLESVVAYYQNRINEFEQLEKGRDGVADTEGSSRSTTTIEQRLDQLIQLQNDMVQQQGIIRDEMANQGRRLDEMAAFLSKLGYPAGTSPPPAA